MTPKRKTTKPTLLRTVPVGALPIDLFAAKDDNPIVGCKHRLRSLTDPGF
jgi:hypothetical protein